MKRSNRFIQYILFISVVLLFSGYVISNKQPVMATGVYKFSYLSNLNLVKSPKPLNWENPRAFEIPNSVRFKVVNDSVIYKYGCNKDGSIKYSTKLLKTPLHILKTFKQVPRNYLDYELVGVYNFDHLPRDIWEVYYYSKKRKSLMDVHHMFELNRIYNVMIFMDQPKHPFVDFKKFFNVLKGEDASYSYPVIKNGKALFLSNKDILKVL
jgi:hypothetical protein